MPTLQEFVQRPDDIFQDENPFLFLDVWGAHHFYSQDRLTLEDTFKSSEGGRFYAIIKADWEVRFRIRTENWGFFGDEELDADFKAAYDIVIDEPFLDVTGYKSSMSFTLRGSGMVAVTADGERGYWHREGSTFQTGTEWRGIIKPTFTNNGMLISFTHPFGDYSNHNAKTIFYNDPDDQTRVDLVWARRRTDGQSSFDSSEGYSSTGDIVDEDNLKDRGFDDGYLSPTGWGVPLMVEQGVDVNGDEWKVEVRLNHDTNEWYVVTNGTIGSRGYLDNDGGFDEVVSAARLKAEVIRKQAEVLDDDDNGGFDTTFGFVAGGSLLLVGAVVVILLLSNISKVRGS